MAAYGMFRLPDGRSLKDALTELEVRVRAPTGKRQAGVGGGRRRRARETASLERRFAGGAGDGHGHAEGPGAAPGGAPHDLDEELAAAARLGQRRRRRILNDRLLRDLAGPLDAAEMGGLFLPPPFGGPTRASVLGDALARGAVPSDAADRACRAGAEVVAREPDSEDAAWLRVRARARTALRAAARRSRGALEALEHRLIALREEAAPPPGGEEPAVVIELESAYERLIAHGLADYHALASVSAELPSGGRAVVAARRAPPAPRPRPPPCADLLARRLATA